MQNKTIILIAERNPHIRDFVKRNLVAEGYNVFTAENVLDVKNWFLLRSRPDILVLDPDLPGSESHNIWEILSEYPELPVILHCLTAVELNYQKRSHLLYLVEKNSNSITFLIREIKQILSKHPRNEITS